MPLRLEHADHWHETRGADRRRLPDREDRVAVHLVVTNPVATLVFKALICIKARDALVVSCHRDAAAVGARGACLWAGLAGLLDGWVLGDSLGAKRRAADLPGVIAQRRGGALDDAGQLVRGEPLAQVGDQMLVRYRFG